MRNLGWIELMRARGAFADELIIGDVLGRDICGTAESFAGSPGRSFGTAEPPEPEHEHNNRGDDAQAGRRKWRCAEERHRNRVLDCRSRIAGPKLRHGRATRART